MSFLCRRALTLKPASFAAQARYLATPAEAQTPAQATESVFSAPAAPTSVEPIASTSAAAAGGASLPRERFPVTPAPTPYHPYVHLPLLRFAPSSTPSSTPAVKELVPLPSPLFNTPSRPSLLHKLVISHLASLRMGTASTKNRSEVNYSGKKIRPQKGTGGARLGSRGSPMLTGGGRAFGPRPKGEEGWRMKVNRKEERLGLRVALSEKWRAGDLQVVDRLALKEASTRDLALKLKSRDWADALFVLAEHELGSEQAWEGHLFQLAAGNLPKVATVSELEKLGTYDVVRQRKVIVELQALDGLVQRLDPDNVLGFGDEEVEFEEDGYELLGEEEMAAELEQALKESGVQSA